MRDIIITLPKSVKWGDYEKELAKAEAGETMNFKLSSLPKESGKGAKCYLVYDGYVRGYMIISGMAERSFTCTTTGKQWSGKFLERTGKFHKLDKPVKKSGFQGWHYYEHKTTEE